MFEKVWKILEMFGKVKTMQFICEMHAALLKRNVSFPKFFLANLRNDPLLSLDGLSRGKRLTLSDFMLRRRVLNAPRSSSLIKWQSSCPHTGPTHGLIRSKSEYNDSVTALCVHSYASAVSPLAIAKQTGLKCAPNDPIPNVPKPSIAMLFSQKLNEPKCPRSCQPQFLERSMLERK